MSEMNRRTTSTEGDVLSFFKYILAAHDNGYFNRELLYFLSFFKYIVAVLIRIHGYFNSELSLVFEDDYGNGYVSIARKVRKSFEAAC